MYPIGYRLSMLGIDLPVWEAQRVKSAAARMGGPLE
jgi:hypothetical protein